MDSGLSLIFQVDGKLKKVAGGQKKAGGGVAELAAGGWWLGTVEVGGLGKYTNFS